MTNEQIKSYFCNADDLWKVLYKFEADIKQKQDKYLEDSENDDYKNSNKAFLNINSNYRQMIFVKLNYIFRMQMPLNDDEAETFYNNEENFEFIKERFELYYNMIDYINNELEVAYIPDKLTTCAYFRISADTWTTFINYSNLNDNRIKTMFESLESFLISSITTGVENGQLNKIAWRKLELKGKYGGNDVEYSTGSNSQNNTILGVVNDKHKELENKLKNKYNFIEPPKEDE